MRASSVLQTPLVLWQSAGLLELLQLGCCVHPAGTRFGSETPALGRQAARSLAEWMSIGHYAACLQVSAD